MGAVLGLCSAAQLACCCGSAACSLCCSACPSCKNSTSTRIMYAVMLLLGTITACIMLSPGLQESLEKVPFCHNYSIPGMPSISNICEAAVGYLAVYRLCFAMTCFFFLMALIMIGVKSSKDPRAGIQNGFWAIKYLILVGGVVGAFFIPSESDFGSVWMYIGMVGGLLFILIQLILIIDFAHGWAESWVEKYEESESKGWYFALLFATCINYLLAITAIVLFYLFYANNTACGLHKFFISFNLILCFIISFVSVLPKVQEAQPRSGLLQASVVSLYTMYLTWSAMSNQPDYRCNPKLEFPGTTTSSPPQDKTFDAVSIAGLVIWICCVLYSSIRTATNTQVGKLTMSEKILIKDDSPVDGAQRLVDNEAAPTDPESGKGQVWDNEDEGVAYSWSFFHLMFALATLYIMMTLTNWYNMKSNIEDMKNEASLWVKIISSWLCIILYLWTLVAPIILRNRDFS